MVVGMNASILRCCIAMMSQFGDFHSVDLGIIGQSSNAPMPQSVRSLGLAISNAGGTQSAFPNRAIGVEKNAQMTTQNHRLVLRLVEAMVVRSGLFWESESAQFASDVADIQSVAHVNNEVSLPS